MGSLLAPACDHTRARLKVEVPSPVWTGAEGEGKARMLLGHTSDISAYAGAPSPVDPTANHGYEVYPHWLGQLRPLAAASLYTEFNFSCLHWKAGKATAREAAGHRGAWDPRGKGTCGTFPGKNLGNCKLISK